jgi:hypothetical protein
VDDGDAWTRMEVFGRLLDFLNRLDAAHVYYTLGHTRPESVMVDISLPGWRWEVEFMLDGSIEIERYKGYGQDKHENHSGPASPCVEALARRRRRVWPPERLSVL